ncbi:hypothetical protein O6H91_17G055200 [Diphasiastrum complanatum]|nr:hypothetical protein O6H91_17G055200 [Diphasiastrum complanatum]
MSRRCNKAHVCAACNSSAQHPKPQESIPGSYGAPFIGALRDRLDFFWFQGEDEFFRKRKERYGSTIFRVNFVPGMPGIALLDQKSYLVLYDPTKVDKHDTFVGALLPKTDFTGGYRVLAYLDPLHPKHAILKSFIMELIKSNSSRILPEFATAFSETFNQMETALSEGREANFSSSVKMLVLDFLLRAIVHRDPRAVGAAALGDDGPSLLESWIAVQFAAIAQAGLPPILEEIFLHSFPLPFSLIRANYQRIYSFFDTYAIEALDVAKERFDLERDEATHNLIFAIGVNAWLGLIKLLPSIIFYVGKNNSHLHDKLRGEIRAAVASNGGRLSPKAIESMPLVRSTVLEVLRLASPAKYQYARARKDLIIESHDASFVVKKGELLCGCLSMASRDPVIFENPDSFIPERFEGGDGEKLLPHLLWSNGPEHLHTTSQNKQCAGKDLVILIASLLLAHIFIRYDTFELVDQPSSAARKPPQICFKTLQIRATDPTSDLNWAQRISSISSSDQT